MPDIILDRMEGTEFLFFVFMQTKVLLRQITQIRTL